MAESINQFISLLRQSALLPLFFAVVVVVFAVMSSLYLYHWRKYSINPKAEHFAKILYFGVSAVLIFGALLSLLAL